MIDFLCILVVFGLWIGFVFYHTRGKRCPYCAKEIETNYCELCDVEWGPEEL
jgi:hypothetical protein